MLKKHLEYILVFIVLALGIQIKNSLFSPKNNHSLIQSMSQPNTAYLGQGSIPQIMVSQPKMVDDIESKNSDLEKTSAVKTDDGLEYITISSNDATKNPNTDLLNKNTFTQTYQKFANLEFNKGQKKQFLIDFKDFKDQFLSLGFTVDQGEIEAPEVTIQYSNGDSEILKLPYDQMFLNDWIKLNLKPDLDIQSLLVSAQSPKSKSVFSFFIQKNI